MNFRGWCAAFSFAALVVWSWQPCAADEYGGVAPQGGVFDGGDALYGVTSGGGPNCRADSSSRLVGCGVVFRLAYDGRYQVIHAFSGSDGRSPASGVAVGTDGLLYGVTDRGGRYDHGTIWRMRRDGSNFSVVFDFRTGVNGINHGALTAGPAGSLFGVEPSNDPRAQGPSIFKVTPDGAYVTLHMFDKNASASPPLLLDATGMLRGFVFRHDRCGGGLFLLSMSGTYQQTSWHERASGGNGCVTMAMPTSGLISGADGTLYATDPASIYKIQTDGAISTLFTLPASNSKFTIESMMERGMGLASAFLDGSLAVDRSGALVGLTSRQLNDNCGSVFRYVPSGEYRALEIFSPGTNPCYGDFGYQPDGMGLTIGADGAIYGVAPAGLDCGSAMPLTIGPKPYCGSVYRILDGHFKVLHEFAEASAPVPLASSGPPLAARLAFEPLPYDGAIRIGIRVSEVPNVDYTAHLDRLTLEMHPVDARPGSGPVSLHPENSVADVNRATIFAGPPLAPGMYAIDVRHVADVFTDMDGKAIQTAGPYPTRLYVPPVPDAPPALARGQRFYALPGDQLQEAATDADGRAFGTRSITLEKVEPKQRSPATLTLSIEGLSKVFRFESNATDATSIPGFTPVVDDPTVRRLNAEYDGRATYAKSDLEVQCVTPSGALARFESNRLDALRVRSIARLFDSRSQWAIGAMNARGVDRESSYTSLNPVIVVFDKPAKATKLSVEFITRLFANEANACENVYAEFSDAWDTERTLSLVSPASRLDWPKPMREAVLAGRILKGMSYDMVAAVVGYPSTYGTATDMKKLDTWYYDLPTPFMFAIKFKNGKVVEYDPPGNLP